MMFPCHPEGITDVQAGIDYSQLQAMWAKDNLAELHNDDALWGFMIWGHEWLKNFKPLNMDPTICCLVSMGIYDWKAPDASKGHALQAGALGCLYPLWSNLTL